MESVELYSGDHRAAPRVVDDPGICTAVVVLDGGFGSRTNALDLRSQMVALMPAAREAG